MALSLGVKGIRIGPKPPGFVTPVFKILQEKFDLQAHGQPRPGRPGPGAGLRQGSMAPLDGMDRKEKAAPIRPS